LLEQIVGAESQAPQPRIALVAGGTGLVGTALLQRLLRTGDFSRVHAITRRPLLLDHPKLANRVMALEDLGPRVTGMRCTDAFCCIGAAGGRSADVAQLQKVDLALTVAFARAAKSVGATRMVVVSAANADRASKAPFARIKGEMEVAVREMGFASLDFVQPGCVLGQRPKSGFGDLLAMTVMPVVNPLLIGKSEALRGIGADDLAAAMFGAARSQRRGVSAWSGRALLALAAAGRRVA
jgi:uncharacterized protein YbjT (DUF2867 family)